MEETVKESSSPFKKIDDSIFKAIDDFQETPTYSKLTEPLEELDETAKNYLGYGIGIAIVLAPLIIVAYLVFRNAELREELELKEATLISAQEFLERREQIDQAARSLISQTVFSNQNQVREEFSNHLQSMGLPGDTITLIGFKQENLSTSMIQTQVNISFKDIALNELMRLFNLLGGRSKFKIDYLSIDRDPNSTLLKGKFGIVHFGKLVE